MDNEKIGILIQKLRREKGFTQKEIADMLGVSDKAVSKWERGNGCPDISLWATLSEVLGADIKKLLMGELYPNKPDIGKMEKTKFYVCPSCGNILLSSGPASVSCCGRRLPSLSVQRMAETSHELMVSEMDGELYVFLSHEMEKSHYIQFIAYVTGDRVTLCRLYPEQEAAARFPRNMGGGRFYLYCSTDGLFTGKLRELPKK